jgi:hypothetical protein
MDHEFLQHLQHYHRKAAPVGERLGPQHLRTVSDTQMDRVRSLIKEAKGLLAPLRRLHAVPFRVCFFDDRAENGYPHTQLDRIMLPHPAFWKLSNSQQIELLIHELIHVFQRYNPLPVHDYIASHSKMNRLARLRPSGTRDNPDLNGIEYADDTNTHLRTLFRPQAKTLADVKLLQLRPGHPPRTINTFHPSDEHPYEHMAYTLAKQITTKNIPNEVVQYL